MTSARAPQEAHYGRGFTQRPVKPITHTIIPFHLELDVDLSQTACKDTDTSIPFGIFV